MFLRILSDFLSQNFSRHCSTMTCEAGLCHRYGERHSRITFPGCAETFTRPCYHLANKQTHSFFSYNFSSDRMNSLLERLRFSRIIFRHCGEKRRLQGPISQRMSQMPAWKSYARKSASIGAKHLQCSEKFLENGEKYSEKRHIYTEFCRILIIWLYISFWLPLSRGERRCLLHCQRVERYPGHVRR
jgi:hypothetical protein